MERLFLLSLRHRAQNGPLDAQTDMRAMGLAKTQCTPFLILPAFFPAYRLVPLATQNWPNLSIGKKQRKKTVGGCPMFNPSHLLKISVFSAIVQACVRYVSRLDPA